MFSAGLITLNEMNIRKRTVLKRENLSRNLVLYSVLYFALL